MTSYVVDASAYEAASPLIETAERLYAPELIDVEVASTLRKLVLRRVRTSEDATEEFHGWLANDVRRVSHRAYATAIWDLRHNITPYDAAYVALAMQLGIPLITRDRRLAAAASAYCEVAQP